MSQENNSMIQLKILKHFWYYPSTKFDFKRHFWIIQSNANLLNKTQFKSLSHHPFIFSPTCPPPKCVTCVSEISLYEGKGFDVENKNLRWSNLVTSSSMKITISYSNLTPVHPSLGERRLEGKNWCDPKDITFLRWQAASSSSWSLMVIHPNPPSKLDV